MQSSTIQNVFDEMFTRFRSRTETLSETERSRIVETTEAQKPQATDDVEVIDVCDSDDDCPKDDEIMDDNDDVVFVGHVTPVKCAVNPDPGDGTVKEQQPVTSESVPDSGRERRLSGESVRQTNPSVTQSKKDTGARSRINKKMTSNEKPKLKPKPRKKAKTQCLTYGRKKQNSKSAKDKAGGKSKTANAKAKSKAKKSVEQAKKVLKKSMSASKTKAGTGQNVKNNKSKGKRGGSVKNNKTSAKMEDTTVNKTKITRKKITRKRKKKGTSEQTDDGEGNEEGNYCEKRKRFFDVLDEVLKDDTSFSHGFLSFLHPPVKTSIMTSSFTDSLVTDADDSNSFFRPCLHRGNTIIKEN